MGTNFAESVVKAHQVTGLTWSPRCKVHHIGHIDLVFIPELLQLCQSHILDKVGEEGPNPIVTSSKH